MRDSPGLFARMPVNTRVLYIHTFLRLVNRERANGARLLFFFFFYIYIYIYIYTAERKYNEQRAVSAAVAVARGL